MGNVLKVVFGIVLFTLMIFALGVVVEGENFFMYKIFAPAYASVEREVFENTKSYNQGMAQEIQNMQFEYVKASQEHKDALASIILHRTADFDVNKLPDDTRHFIEQLRQARLTSK
jgi:hypothetical protein